MHLVFLPALGREMRAEYDAHRAEQVAATSRVEVGDPIPEFTVTTVDGEEFSTADAAGDVILLNFFATWCGPCLAELPHLDRIAAERRGSGLRVLAVGREETAGSVAAFRDRHGYTLPMAADPDRAVYGLFAEELIQRTVVIGRDGRIAHLAAGFTEEDLPELNAVLDAELRGGR